MEIVGSGVLMGLVVLVVGNILIFISGEGGVGGVIASIFGLFILYFSAYYVEKKKVVVEEQALIGVKSGLESHRELFLIEGYYNIGWIEKNGGEQPFLMPFSSIVYKKNNIFPHYVKKCVENKYLFHDYYDNCHSEIYVPIGSVKAEFGIK